MIGYIYLARNTKDNMVYIGQTRKSLEERKKSHRILSKYYPFRICCAIVKDGFDAFTWEVLEEVEGVDKADMQAKLNKAERKYISMYRSYDPAVGYNDTYGGRDGRLVECVEKRRVETRRMRDKERPSRHHSEQTRQKLSEALRRRHARTPVSAEWRQKHSLFMKEYYSISANRKKLSNTMRGRKLSEEQKEKIKRAQKNAKPVVCVETGIMYASIKEAARVMNTTPNKIRESIHEHRKVKGVSFLFV